MADVSRIDELRGRLQKDPASIAFAQLAEEYRRAGRFQESIDTCRAGLARHPGYMSARVTLGRALLEIGELQEAQRELAEVRRAAPENLAAIRGLAEVHRRRGELPEALDEYRSAFELARNDPGIEQIVRDLKKELGPRQSGRTHSAPPQPSHGAAPATAQPRQAAPAIPRATTPAETPDQARAHRVTSYLQRWLAAVLADRRSRLYHAPA